MTNSWIAACLQTLPVSLADAKTADEVRRTVAAGVARYDQLIGDVKAATGASLYLLPEKALGDREQDLRGCLRFPGPEIEMMQNLAAKHRVYVAANSYTLNDEFPGRYFNTSFMLAPDGNIVLKSYRLHTYHSTSPHDFWQRFIDKVGLDGAFPVAKTPLGNIAMLPSMELMYPEIGRMFVLRGAEVLMHTTMERIVDRSTKRTRAAENMVYLMSANVPNSVGTDQFMDVSSLIVNWRGQVLAECKQGTTGYCAAEIDIDILRARRADPDLTYPAYGVNYLSRLRTEIAATGYAAAKVYPVDSYNDGSKVTQAIDPAGANAPNLRQSLRNMAKLGMLPADGK